MPSSSYSTLSGMSDLLSGLGNLTKSLTSNISTYEIRKISEKVQGMVMNYTETEQLVRDATNEDPWGPTGPQMKEISNLTFQYDNFHQVMGILWKRMFEDNKYAWRRVYKSLMLLNHLLANGSERVIASARDHTFQMRSLEHYKYTDEKGRDQGINVRHRAKLILELLGDEEKLRAERKKAKNDDKSKFQGFSAEEMRSGRGGSYNSSNDFTAKRRPSFEDEPPARETSKEVNSFSFPSERRDSNSPELGFRDEPVHKEDDDDFGDFASARTTTTTATKVQTANIPRIGGPSSFAAPASNKASAPANNSCNLLDLEMGLPSTPAVDFSSPVNLPRPPSGGPSSNGGSNNLTDDLFGAAPDVQTSTSTNLFEPDWSSAPVSPPQNNASANFADFGAFSSAAPITSPVATAPLPSASTGADDLFGLNLVSPVSAAPLSSQPLSPSGGGLLDFGAPLAFSSAPVAAPTPVQAKPVSTPSSNAKVGSTWADTSGLINLDNLGMKGTPTKANVPMNQMNKQNNTPLPW